LFVVVINISTEKNIIKLSANFDSEDFYINVKSGVLEDGISLIIDKIYEYIKNKE